MKHGDVGGLPVMPANCKTCPFKEIDGRWQDAQLANTVIERTLFKGQQICHGTEGPNREPRFRCKGAFDHAQVIYERCGMADFIVREARKVPPIIKTHYL